MILNVIVYGIGTDHLNPICMIVRIMDERPRGSRRPRDTSTQGAEFGQHVGGQEDRYTQFMHQQQQFQLQM